MRIRLTCVPRRPLDLVPFARAVEEVGLDGIGIADSPQLHGSTHAVVQHLLSTTNTIAIGPCVTNPVTRHPSVHAADLDALESLYPGRVFFAIGTGDSAVSSVGLGPATARQTAACIDIVHQRVGDRVPALFAIGGPKAAAAVPSTADGVVLGGGLDVAWSSHLVALAERSAGKPLTRWGFLVASLGPASDADHRGDEVLGSVTTVARHALHQNATLRGVPPELAPGLRQIFDRYDVGEHGRLESTHHATLRRSPEHAQYLLERFAVVDASPASVRRLRDYATALDLDGFYLSSTVPDQILHAEFVASELLPALSSKARRV